jgi:hypothetical protein
MYLGRTSSRAPLTRRQFDETLRAWLKGSDAERISEAKFGVTPWLWVRSEAGELCHLNADTKRAGVARYFALGEQAGHAVPWLPVTSARGSARKLGFGTDGEVIPGFYLYRRLSA